MTGNYHIGDRIVQHGPHSIGMIKNQAPADPRTAFHEMIDAVQAFRMSVPPADRRTIDESLQTIQSPATAAGRDGLRRALANVAGLAALVGQAGVPVIESIRKVATALGL